MLLLCHRHTALRSPATQFEGETGELFGTVRSKVIKHLHHSNGFPFLDMEATPSPQVVWSQGRKVNGCQALLC